MRIALIISLLLICSTHCLAQQSNTAASPSPVPQSVSDLLERAKKLSQAGRGQLAITLIQEAARIAPNSHAVRVALGNEFAKAGRFNEAITEFELARKINPRDDGVYLSVGLIMLQQKKYAIAASLFYDASLLNPNEPLHPLMLGAALVRQASDKEVSSQVPRPERDRILNQAEEALNKASDLSGGRLFEVHLYRARLYELRGARMEAASELEKYLEAYPDSARANEVREAIRILRTQTGP